MLAVNEQLGHYTVRNSVSVNKLEDVYELEMEASPSPEDESLKNNLHPMKKKKGHSQASHGEMA